MVRLVVRPDAERDVAEAVQWYDDQGSHLGDRFLDDLRKVLSRIRSMPRQFPAVGEAHRALLQTFPYGVYFLIVDSGLVVVVGVLHQRRNPSVWRRRIQKE